MISKKIKLRLDELKLAVKASLRALYEPVSMVTFAVLFFLFIILLQWLFQYRNFLDIITNSSQSALDKIDIILDAFGDVFRFIDDLTPISFILIALLQAVSIAIWLELRRYSSGKKSKQQFASLGLGLIGSGCVACGGSILSPLLAAVATSISVSAAQAVGDAVLILAIAFSYRSWKKIALQYNHVMRQVSTK